MRPWCPGHFLQLNKNSNTPAGLNLLATAHIFVNIEQMRRRQYLGNFELMVLLAILRVGEDAYGMLIAREIEAASGKEVGLGSVYAALERLAEKGLESSIIGDPTPERGGRAKQYVHVTSKGLRAAREARHTFAKLWHGIPALKGSAT